MATATKSEYQVSGTNASALFTLKIHRGEGMLLLAMNWKKGKPPLDLVGFAIEYKEPGGEKFYSLNNRLAFPNTDGSVDPNRLSTLRSPIQKFRWVHFPRNAEMPGKFTYRVTPVFMDKLDKLSYGDSQEAAIALMRDTYPGKLNVTFTRGFVSSQAFVDRYETDGHTMAELIPGEAKDGLDFVPTHPKTKEALAWMGFEARNAILELLDKAIEDKKAQVMVLAYDLNEPELVKRMEKLGTRLKIIIDDNERDHGKPNSAESKAAKRLRVSAGKANVQRQHVGNLQHNKTIIVDGPKAKLVLCGSTNFSWRGFFVQSNNAVILKGSSVVNIFSTAFNNFWQNKNAPAGFGNTNSAKWNNLNLPSINAKVAFSPHVASNAVLKSIADDISNSSSSVLYSLAFLYETPGVIQNAILNVSKDNNIFVYGISDKRVGGIVLQKPDGNISPVFPSALTGKLTPEPFKSEPKGDGGTRMHHKFVVVDFDKPTARVYLGSYNFSVSADTKNGENLLLIKDRKIVTAYMIEAIRIFDHYHFRIAQMDADTAQKKLLLVKPPRKAGEKPWWEKDYTVARRIRDREIFS